jgi:hypothetical protein
MNPLGGSIRIASFAVWTSLALAGCLRPDPNKAVATTPAALPPADEQRLRAVGRRPNARSQCRYLAATARALISGTVARAGQVATRNRNARRLLLPNWASGSTEATSRAPRASCSTRDRIWLGRGGLELVRLVAPDGRNGPQTVPQPDLPDSRRIEVSRRRSGPPQRRGPFGMQQREQGPRPARWFRSTTGGSTTASGTR